MFGIMYSWLIRTFPNNQETLNRGLANVCLQLQSSIQLFYKLMTFDVKVKFAPKMFMLTLGANHLNCGGGFVFCERKIVHQIIKNK